VDLLLNGWRRGQAATLHISPLGTAWYLDGDSVAWAAGREAVALLDVTQSEPHPECKLPVHAQLHAAIRPQRRSEEGKDA
jgi:hypothetical protein